MAYAIGMFIRYPGPSHPFPSAPCRPTAASPATPPDRVSPSLRSGIFGERLPLRYYLSGGMVLSGVFTALFGLGYFWNIHVLWYFIVVQVCPRRGTPRLWVLPPRPGFPVTSGDEGVPVSEPGISTPRKTRSRAAWAPKPPGVPILPSRLAMPAAPSSATGRMQTAPG